ncbi:MAG TPA: STAS domain-containing protein [Pilimelia sp.]|nr:STAS domain-containing protein [Pilimelia sp.]
MNHGGAHVRHDGRYGIIQLTGEIDHANAARLEREVHTAATAAPAVILDLTLVTFLDSAGLRLLDSLVRSCADRRCPVLVVAPSPGAVRFTLELMGFRPDLLMDTLDEARTVLAPP